MAEFRTRVHIAGVPEGAIQKCFRCDCVLVDATGSMVLSSTNEGAMFWASGCFVGCVEFADGRRTNPTSSFMMDRDAKEVDEVACRA